MNTLTNVFLELGTFLNIHFGEQEIDYDCDGIFNHWNLGRFYSYQSPNCPLATSFTLGKFFISKHFEYGDYDSKIIAKMSKTLFAYKRFARLTKKRFRFIVKNRRTMFKLNIKYWVAILKQVKY